MGRHSHRHRLLSNAYVTGGYPSRQQAQALLRRVAEITATGYTRAENVDAAIRLECSELAAVRLIAALGERDERLGPWTKLCKGKDEVLCFSSERDAVLARILLSE